MKAVSRPWRPGREAVLLLGLGLLWLLYAVRHWRMCDHFLESMWPDTFQPALALRSLDPGLFERDELLRRIETVWPPLFNAALGLCISLFEPYYSQMILFLAGLEHLIFVAGIYALVRSCTSEAVQESRFKFVPAFLVALLSFRVRQIGGGAGAGFFGVSVNGGSSDIFTQGLLPWLFLAFLKAGQSPARLGILGACLGLLAWLKPVTMAHLALLCGLTLLSERGSKPAERLRSGLTLGVAFLALFAPLLLRYLREVSGEPVSVEHLSVLRLRSASLFPSAGELAWSWLASLALPALWAAFAWPRWRASAPGPIQARTHAFLVLAFLLHLSGFFTHFWPGLAPAMTLRASGFLLYPLFLMAAFLWVGALNQPSYGRLALASVLWAANTLVTDIRLPPPRGLEQVWPVAQKEKEEGLRLVSPERISDFIEMARNCKEGTPREALFLVPPRGLSSFRLYARRAVVVTYPDGTAGLHSAKFARLWQERSADVEEAYRSRRLARLIESARRWEADYILLLKEDIPSRLPFMESPYFWVHKVGS